MQMSVFHHTLSLLVVLANTPPASLVEFDDEPSPLNRVDEDIAAGERVVAPSADELDSASTGLGGKLSVTQPI
jgi:hypothetical protein